MTRAYLRLDPGFFERKVIRQGYPPAVAMALVGAYCLAESQPERGRFRDERLLRAMLGDLGRHVPELLKRRDILRLADGRIYPEGWDEWQEGDWKVGERVRRIRDRAKTTVATVTSDTVATVQQDTTQSVYTPSEAGHSGAGHSGNLLKEDTSRARADERADIAALLERGWKRVTKAQRRVLDELLERHDVTGPAFAAEVIRATPADKDPLEAVMAADRLWQDAQRRKADADEAAWAATKAEDPVWMRSGDEGRAAAPESVGSILEGRAPR